MLLVLAGCAHRIRPAARPGQSAIALTAGPNTSLVYLSRVDGGGLIAIDLGWWGATRSVREALSELRAQPGEVSDVFLTHSHRDHIGAWRLFQRSRFHLAAAELAAFTGKVGHSGWIPRIVEKFRRTDLPPAGALEVHGFSSDTTFVFGADTVFAYLVPGHTAGSTAYLHRGTLFIGDAMTFSRWTGFGAARRGYSDDAELASQSLRALWPRLPRDAVKIVCTAHAKCFPYKP